MSIASMPVVHPTRNYPLPTQVIACVLARVLASNRTPFPATIPLRLVQRTSSPDTLALTFGITPLDATAISIASDRVRIEHLEQFHAQPRLYLWVEFPRCAWQRLLQQAGVLLTKICGLQVGPEPTSIPPAPPLAYPYRIDG